MSEYTVQRGDTLWSIARRHGIRYWPNLYLATENNDFRNLRPNPNLILPGDSLTIPSMESIRPMENRPAIVHRDIPLYTQSAETCWRATGKMLYLRRHRAGNAEAEFNRRIGDHYRTLNRGLRSENWNDFYHTRLGMQETQIASPNDLHYIIATRGPVIASIGAGNTSHSMIVAGYNVIKGQWFVVDPAAGEQLAFAEDVITAGNPPSSSSDSSSEAVLTDYQTGPATWNNMGRWLWIFDTTIHQRIFHY